MTTLYRPVRIETAELPMDKFPEGTIATHPDYWPVERCSCSRWESDGPDRYDPDMVGWTALVPIEAEEEATARMEHSGVVTNLGGSVTDHEKPSRCLVTPWESR